MLSVLIVEDVDEMRALLEHLVNGMDGFRVSGTAQNGFEARLEVHRRRPDLIFLDEVLPVGEASADLLKDWLNDQIPVFLCTSVEQLDRPLGGAVGRFLKPTWDSLDEDRQRIRQMIIDLLNLVPTTHGTEA